MNINDIRSKTNKELFGMINKLKAELLALRFQIATGQLDTPHEIKNVKKDIARVYTAIAENNAGIIVEPKKAKDKHKSLKTKETKNTEPKKLETKPEVKVEAEKIDKEEAPTKKPEGVSE